MTDSESKPADSADVVEEILKTAGRRDPAPQDVALRSKAALREHWQGVVAERRTAARNRRRVAMIGLAAGLAATVGLVVSLTRISVSPMTRPEVAELQRTSGNAVTVKYSADDQYQAFSGDPITVDAALQTGADSSIALRLVAGGSVRLDEQTRVVFASEKRLELTSGAVYFDSKSVSHPNRERGSIVIATAFGDITHVGTQFEVRSSGDSLSIAVREGVALLRMGDESLLVEANEALYIDTDLAAELEPIPSYGPRWQWVDSIAPMQSVDGQLGHWILEWIARETGRTIKYTSEEAAAYASTAPVTGIKDVTPSTMLKALPIALDLDYEEVGETIEVSLREPQD